MSLVCWDQHALLGPVRARFARRLYKKLSSSSEMHLAEAFEGLCFYFEQLLLEQSGLFLQAGMLSAKELRVKLEEFIGHGRGTEGLAEFSGSEFPEEALSREAFSGEEFLELKKQSLARAEISSFVLDRVRQGVILDELLSKLLKMGWLKSGRALRASMVRQGKRKLWSQARWTLEIKKRQIDEQGSLEKEERGETGALKDPCEGDEYVLEEDPHERSEFSPDDEWESARVLVRKWRQQLAQLEERKQKQRCASRLAQRGFRVEVIMRLLDSWGEEVLEGEES